MLAYIIPIVVPFFLLTLLTISIGRDLALFFKPLSKEHKKILTDLFLYYQRLDPKKKIQFEKRVNRFIRLKHFVPRDFAEVSDEMKVLISASAVQLTFGLHEIYLTHFDRILIYPDAYFSFINRQYHKGEVNPRHGVIVLSWKAFQEGYEQSTTAMNLGLHEMAHALHLEDKIIYGQEGCCLDEKLLVEYQNLSQNVIKKIQNGQEQFFRKYAATNDEEFFAVSIECFFEKPSGFLENHPKLYHTLASILKQDPLEVYMSGTAA